MSFKVIIFLLSSSQVNDSSEPFSCDYEVKLFGYWFFVLTLLQQNIYSESPNRQGCVLRVYILVLVTAPM